jgi:hypothetical protein
MHSCPICGKPTEGAWSEGGVKWAICEECMEKESRPPRLDPDIFALHQELINLKRRDSND